MESGLLDAICGALKLEKPGNPSLLNPLVLAYVGDTVFDLAVRSMLICRHDVKAQALHRLSSRRVCAAAQAQALNALSPTLTEVEADIVRRARNAKPGTIPKNAKPEDYRAATALEALLGWLYLDGQEERLWALIAACLDAQAPDRLEQPRGFRP